MSQSGPGHPAPPPPPSLNASPEGDRSVIRLRPAPDTDPILVVSLDARHVETVLASARLYRPTCAWADEVNRVDKLISTCERALAIYRDWYEERSRAAEERHLTENRFRQHSGDGQGGPPAEAGGGGGAAPAERE